jgi:hypothetical protein
VSENFPHEWQQSKLRRWCATCEPDVDPTRELVERQACPTHSEGISSADDHNVPDHYAPVPSAQEAGGDANARWCALVHRNERLPLGTIKEVPYAGQHDAGMF